MSYRDYVIAAYAVFAVVLLWDFVIPRIQIRQQLRAARARAARAAGKPANPRPAPAPMTDTTPQ